MQVQAASVIEQVSEIANENTSLIEKIPLLVNRFQKKEGQWITSNCQCIQEGDRHYYGIHKNDQSQGTVMETRKLYQELKLHILERMGLPADTHVVQVVGDSASFSAEGTEKARFFLSDCINGKEVVLYGYTGHAEENGTRCVNAAVTDVIAEKEMEQHVIGNLVGFHTPAALKGWGCTGPSLNHYILVYGDEESSRETGTVFGDDVISSDYFTDRLLLLEGGAQSFRQVCHALLLDQNITVLSSLREASKAYKTEESFPDKIKTPYFNASFFLKELHSLVEQGKGKEELQKWYSAYFGKGKCYISDPKRPDFDTKQKLMDEAWKLFIEELLYLKIKQFVTELEVECREGFPFALGSFI